MSLLCSISFGFYAHQFSEKDAIRRWEKKYIPSYKIYRHSLESYGWHEEMELKKVEKMARLIPTQLDEQGSIWRSEDWNWILIYSYSNELEQPKFYCLNCSRGAKNWTPLGVGWRAFEDLLAGLEEKCKLASSLKPQKHFNSVRWKDSREIVF